MNSNNKEPVTFKPKRIGYTHTVLILVLDLAGLVAVLGSGYQTTFAPVLLQSLGVLSLAVSVYVVNRYSLSTYLYTIEGDSPELLTVYRINGRKKTDVASVDLSTVRSVERVGGESRPKTKGSRRLNCCLNIFPAERAIITFTYEGRPTELVIETDDAFYEELTARTGK